MKNLLWQSVCLVIITASTPLPRAAIAQELTKEDAAKIDELIEALASPNDAKSLKSNGKTLTFPPDWDQKAETRVARAASSLVKKGPSAFPQLIAHADDKRFSFVNTSGNGAMSPKSVGHACGRIIQVQLDVFEQIGIYPRMYPSYFLDVVKLEDKPKKWLEERKDKSLVELQIESIEWAIQQQTKLLDKWKADQQEQDDQDRLKEIITENEKLLSDLKKTKKPIERTGHPFKIYEGK